MNLSIIGSNELIISIPRIQEECQSRNDAGHDEDRPR